MKTNKSILLAALTTISLNISAQQGFKFTEINRITCPEVQNQGNSGTCWCFSTLSFFESEMAFYGAQDIPNLSEMFVVWHSYMDKAEKKIRMHGNNNFSQGGLFGDNTYVLKHYGMMPESAFPNLQEGKKSINHTNLESKLTYLVDSLANDENKFISPTWKLQVAKILDEYLGKIPEKFEYDGKTYTPESFAKEVVKLNPDDYIQVTSFNHHPFYEYFALEIPDNWRWGMFYNLPIDEMIAVIDTALAMGHTVAWGSDISEKGFSYFGTYATMPGISTAGMTPKQIADFKKLPVEKQLEKAKNLSSPGLEISVTQESRQADFDNRNTTDDHGMQIIGTANDQKGNKFYIVKNSWGKYNSLQGYVYVSEAFVKAKTTAIMVHKDACKNFIKQN